MTPTATKRILITGATGNVGREVIRFLYENETPHHVVAGVRDIDKAKRHFIDFPRLDYARFDFEDATTFPSSLQGVDSIFLLRPPHIAAVDTYFRPLINALKANAVKQILFLSVQGVEKSTVIPHNKIEKLIVESGISRIFLRPSYFMQNLTTTLIEDIREKQQIILPAGRARFNWVDVDNIGEVCALLLNNFDTYANRAIEVTGCENLNFTTIAEAMSASIGTRITYRDTNPFKFFQIKKRGGMVSGMIVVMIMLHFLQRFQKAPAISDFYEKLTGKKPTSLAQFIARERHVFAAPLR